MRKLVLFIHGGSAIDDASADICRSALREAGYELRDYSVLDPKVESKLKVTLRDRGDEIFFFYSSNFWALNVRNGDALLHVLTGIPLVVLLHDHPVYFLKYASPSLAGIVLHVPGADLTNFVSANFGNAARVISNSGYWPQAGSGPAPDFDEFLGRKNLLLLPMNLSIFGLNLDDTWSAVKSLPQSRQRMTVRLIEAALTDCLTPLHVIAERLADGGDQEVSAEDLRLALNFVKLWRRNYLVRALIDFPILVSSTYVPADLEFRHPAKFTLLTIAETLPLYRSYRFVANVNPLLQCFHDRVRNTLRANAVCVTDPNLAITRHFEDERDVLYIDFDRNDVAEKMARYLDDPEKAFALTVESHRVREGSDLSAGSYGPLIDAMQEYWTQRDVNE